MLGLAARRSRHQSSLARGLLAYSEAKPRMVSKCSEEVAGSIRSRKILYQRLLLTKCLKIEAMYSGSDLCPQNGAVARAFPIGEFRHTNTSAAGEEYRQIDGEGELQTERDPDYYMKSRYDQESNGTEFQEELPGGTVQLQEDILWRLNRNNEGKVDNVVPVIGDPQVLAAAHERLSERRRNWTLASNELEVSHLPKENRSLRSGEINWNWFKEAAHLLRIGSYSFKPLERLDIAKRGRGEARQWVSVRPKDQVIQEAIRGVLERIYEPVFSSKVRPGASVHSALKSVKYGWKGITWFLQFDVRITDHVSVQHRLLKILAEQIEDEAFLDLLRQMFKLETIWIDTSTDEDMPEGSVLSPMLGNIYFHQLDLEVDRIQEEIRCERPH